MVRRVADGKRFILLYKRAVEFWMLITGIYSMNAHIVMLSYLHSTVIANSQGKVSSVSAYSELAPSELASTIYSKR